MIKLQLADDIYNVEQYMQTLVNQPQSILQQYGHQLLSAGGKRLRLNFVLLASKYNQQQLTPLTQQVATIIEMIHSASLVHDDIIDHAEMRRGLATINVLAGNKIALYCGDYLFATVLNELSHIDNDEIQQAVNHVLQQLCLGEMLQFNQKFDIHQSIDEYLQRIERKTALLIANACKLGALSTFADRHIVEALYDYGYALGMAFQIQDDILDFIGDEMTLGKPIGADLKNGNITLPVLLACRDDDMLMQELLPLATLTSTEIDNLIIKISASKGIELAKQYVQDYSQQAQQALKKLPNHVITDVLDQLIDTLLNRNN